MPPATLVWFTFVLVLFSDTGLMFLFVGWCLLGFFFACQYGLKVCILLPLSLLNGGWDYRRAPTLQALIGSLPTAHKSLD